MPSSTNTPSSAAAKTNTTCSSGQGKEPGFIDQTICSVYLCPSVNLCVQAYGSTEKSSRKSAKTQRLQEKNLRHLRLFSGNSPIASITDGKKE
jgi:hypothetical protein